MSRADADRCAEIVRSHARTFTLASYFLPPPKRRAAFALYAFCRRADDLVDLAGDVPREVVTRRLAEVEEQLEATLAGHPPDAVFRELARAVTTYAIPPAVLRELLAGIARDLEPARYDCWHDLGLYCEGVASTVGEMCTHVFGVADDAQRASALRYARTLGVAMQLTNILRDVGEDGRRGRCYLPADELAAVGLTCDDVLAAAAAHGGPLARDVRWQRFMRQQVARARALYEVAWPGIFLLAPDARRCTAACASGYAAILDAIEAQGLDTFADRARVGARGRAAVLLNAWRATRSGSPAPDVGEGPCVAWEHESVADCALTRTTA